MLSANAIPDLSWQFILGVVVLTTAMVTMARRRMMRRGLSPLATARQRAGERRTSNGAESDLRELLLELEKAAREITAQIDTRYRKLEVGMRAADSRIAELRRLAGAPAGESPAPPRTREQRLDIVVGDEALVDCTPVTSTTPGTRANDYEQVCALADRRLPARDIAARVERPLGEVELMLAMRQQSVAKRVPKAG